MLIIGAGMTGCLAGLMFPDTTIFEAQEEIPTNHNAVLRFRDDSVSKFTGIPFRAVTVHKGIYLDGKYVQPNIQIANMYSEKVLGHIVDRSIWNMETATRYIAPPDFQYQLAMKVKNRIQLGVPIEYIPNEEMITTIPLPATLAVADIETDAKFEYQNIHTARYILSNIDVFQTVYFPGDETPVYRATVTGNNLIIESIKEICDGDLEDVLQAMNLPLPDEYLDNKEQKYGKIKNIDEDERHRLLYTLTARYNIYSAGRFAIWKNVLMDDVLNDLYVIKRMLDTNPYNRHKMR